MAGVAAEMHGISHDHLVGSMRQFDYGGAAGAPDGGGLLGGARPREAQAVGGGGAPMSQIEREDTIAVDDFMHLMRSEFTGASDEGSYAEFCRAVHTGQLHELETILQPYGKLLEAAVRLRQGAWAKIKEKTHADNAMGYIRRVAETCPQEMYAEFLTAIRAAVNGVPVEDVYMRIAHLFGTVPLTPRRRDLLHEFFVCHMPQEARDNVITIRRAQFPALDLLAATAVEQASMRR